jgi:hypothetical protein
MAQASATSPRRRSGRGLRYLLVFLLLILVGVGLWTWLTLSWSYSDGTRAGLLQRFARKGWFCKTEEGDLVLAQFAVVGVTPQVWRFSVRDPSLGAQLEKVVGKSVRLHYTEHPGMPSTCFGDTRYFVDGFVLTDETQPGASPQNGEATQAPAPLPGSASPPTAPPAIPAQPLSPGPPPTVPPKAAPPNP